ncbi:MAG TPA: HEPN family nuclease [Candidatus Tripitaka sp. YC43]
MEYKEFVKDFALRTKTNLELIRQAKKDGEEAYEVTQLINSLLGLLVLPQHEFYNKIPETPLSELEKSGWPIPRVRGNYPQAKDLKELTRHLRNGVAHFNLEFTLSEDHHIDGLIIWDKDRKGAKTWEAELKIKELEAITNKFTELLI